MHKYFRLTAVMLLFGALTLFPIASVEAAELRGGERVNVSADETLEDDLYIGGGSVDSSGIINGDLLTAGGNVVIRGDVSDDLHTAGGNVNVLADVEGDARIVGGSISVVGSIGEDLAVVGGETQLTGESIGGDLLWAGGMITIGTPVSGDAELLGGEAYISAPISGGVEFEGDRLVLEDGAVIEGDLSYSSRNEVEIQDGATVTGEITREPIDEDDEEDDDGNALAALVSTTTLITFFMMLTGALVLGLGLRRLSESLVVGTFARPWADLGRGFIGLVVMPILAVLLMVTVIGLPLGIMTLLGYLALLIFAGLFAPVLLGSLVFKLIEKKDNYQVTWLTILVGVIIFTLLGFIPVIGWIAQFILVLFSIGGILRIKWGVLKNYLGK